MGYLKYKNSCGAVWHRFRQMYDYFKLPENMFEAEVSVDDTRKQLAEPVQQSTRERARIWLCRFI